MKKRRVKVLRVTVKRFSSKSAAIDLSAEDEKRSCRSSNSHMSWNAEGINNDFK